MSSRWRRFEVLLPLQFNDGRDVPPEWLADAVLEIVDHFGAASYETQKVEGHWRHGGVLYRDNLVRVVVDVPDSTSNRKWMREFKRRWKDRLEQLESLARIRRPRIVQTGGLEFVGGHAAANTRNNGVEAKDARPGRGRHADVPMGSVGPRRGWPRRPRCSARRCPPLVRARPRPQPASITARQ